MHNVDLVYVGIDSIRLHMLRYCSMQLFCIVFLCSFLLVKLYSAPFCLPVSLQNKILPWLYERKSRKFCCSSSCQLELVSLQKWLNNLTDPPVWWPHCWHRLAWDRPCDWRAGLWPWYPFEPASGRGWGPEGLCAPILIDPPCWNTKSKLFSANF